MRREKLNVLHSEMKGICAGPDKQRGFLPAFKFMSLNYFTTTDKELEFLIIAKTRSLTRRAERNKKMNPRLKLSEHKFLECAEIDFSVPERSDHRGSATGKEHFFFHNHKIFSVNNRTTAKAGP